MKRYTSGIDLQALCERQGWKCAKCPSPINAGTIFHIDHVTALALGGEDTTENKQLLCVPCHKTKTFGTKATTLGSDIHAIAKSKRLARGKRVAKHPMKSAPRKWPKRKFSR